MPTIDESWSRLHRQAAPLRQEHAALDSLLTGATAVKRRERAAFSRVPLAIAALASLFALTFLPVVGGSTPAAARPGAAEPSVGRGWTHTPLTGISASADVVDIQLVHARSGFVLLLPTYGPTGTRGTQILTSADGASWHPVVLDPSDLHAETRPQLFRAGRFAVLFADRALITEDGITWRHIEGPRTGHGSTPVTGMTSGGPGLVAATGGGGVWTSTDGTAWQYRPLPESPGIVDQVVYSVAQGGPGLVAVGTVTGVVNPGPSAVWTSQGAVWTSKDGVSWQRAWIDTSGNCSTMQEVLSGPHGLLAWGTTRATCSDQSEKTALWASGDGTRWTRVHDYPFMPVAPFSRLFRFISPGGPGFVATAQVDGETTVWSSREGSTWKRESGDIAFGGTAKISALTGAGEDLLAVGFFAPYPPPSCHGGAYTSVQSFVPAAFHWTVANSQAAVPRGSGLDPKALRLRHGDVPSASQAMALGAYGAYIDLCRLVPGLGPHRAYMFGLPTGALDTWVKGLAVVARDTRTAQRVFRSHPYLVDPLLIGDPSFDSTESDAGHSERPVTTRIGAATRAFRVDVLETLCGDYYRARQDVSERRHKARAELGPQDDCTTQSYGAYAVVWQDGRVIGEVFTAGQGGVQKTAALAARQWKRLRR